VSTTDTSTTDTTTTDTSATSNTTTTTTTTTTAGTAGTAGTANETTPDAAGGEHLGTPIDFTEEELGRIVYNEAGLVPAIVQDATDHAVLMFAWMNAESLRKTLETGRTWFWSRSRQEFWCKGETSGDRQFVRSVRYDCDGDVLLVVVDQQGAGACHTGNRSCFYRAFGDPPSRP
jgi:phosphoribosyl-AMP cyclohydrolase